MGIGAGIGGGVGYWKGKAKDEVDTSEKDQEKNRTYGALKGALAGALSGGAMKTINDYHGVVNKVQDNTSAGLSRNQISDLLLNRKNINRAKGKVNLNW